MAVGSEHYPVPWGNNLADTGGQEELRKNEELHRKTVLIIGRQRLQRC